MSNVTDIHGAGPIEPDPNFDPENVLQEPVEPLSQSAFDAPQAGGTPPPAPTPTGKPLKYGAIGVAVVIFAAVAYGTFKPTSTPAPATHAAAVATPKAPIAEAQPMPSSPVPAVAPATAPAQAPAPSTSLNTAASPAAVPGMAEAPTSAPAASASAAGGTPAPAASTPPAAPSTNQEAAITAQLTALEARVDTLQAAVADLRHGLRAGPAETPAKSRTPSHRAVHLASSATRSAATHASAPESKHTGGQAGAPKLKAVLVGQAWFEEANGHTVTVGPGGTVPGLGRVTEINADAGEVHFADGTVVR